MMLALMSRGVEHEVAGDLAAGADEAHNVGMEGQLALQVHFLFEQLQGLRVQPCKRTTAWSAQHTDRQAASRISGNRLVIHLPCI